jgi:hypothetical protein
MHPWTTVERSTEKQLRTVEVEYTRESREESPKYNIIIVDLNDVSDAGLRGKNVPEAILQRQPAE